MSFVNNKSLRPFYQIVLQSRADAPHSRIRFAQPFAPLSGASDHLHVEWINSLMYCGLQKSKNLKISLYDFRLRTDG